MDSFAHLLYASGGGKVSEKPFHIIQIRRGKSTRPGAPPVSAAEELRRVLPVVEALVTLPIPVSIDTSKGEVADV